jgi:fatty-acyl-CoA synthase
MIISGGENIYPAEIESVLLEYPGVRNAAVIGAPDPQWGERVVAVIVTQPGVSLTLGQLLQFCEGRLARYKQPKQLYVLDQLPLNGSGKVVKHQLRQMLATTGD